MKRNYYYPTIPSFSDLDRFFSIASPVFGRLGQVFDSQAQSTAPAADFYEDENNYYVKAELPGVRKGDVQVQFEDGVLSVSAKRKQKKGDTEQSFEYRRSVTVPEGVKADAIQADHVDGILTLTLPKAEQVKPRQIEVN